MTKPQADNKRADARPARFQYTLRGLLALTTAVAIACAVFFTMPEWVSGLVTVCVLISTPGMLTVMVIYGRGYTRTFAIGALFPALLPAGLCLSPVLAFYLITPAGSALGGAFDAMEPGVAFLISLNVYFVLVLGNGLLAVWVRRCVERVQRSSGSQSPTRDDRQATGDVADSSAGTSEADPFAPET